MAIELEWGDPLTEEDLATHQRCAGWLSVRLLEARSRLAAVVAPFDIRLSRFTVVEPDVLVARTSDLTEARLEGPPVLAVEVLSPSSRKLEA